ncbi:MAG: serine--tRNA ligase, partial [Acidimicrobiales bacterium]
MIDIRLARDRPEELRRALARKGAGELFDQLLEADSAWREQTARVDELRSRTKLKASPDAQQLASLKLVKDELRTAESLLEDTDARRSDLLARVPNPPADEVPDGTSDEDAVEVRRGGKEPSHAFAVRDHV